MSAATVTLDFIALESHDGGSTPDRLARVTLAGPDANAFDEATLAELAATLAALASDGGVRVVLLQGGGRHFSSGAALQSMRERGAGDEASNLHSATGMARAFEALAALPLPTVAVARGLARGGGIGLLACCDVVVAARTASLALSETRLGLLPAVILPYLLRRAAAGRINRLALSGRVFTADEACALGLVDLVCEDAGLEAAVRDEVGALLLGSLRAQARFKTLARGVEGHGPSAAATAAAIAAARSAADGQAGLAARLAGLPAPWARRIPLDSRLVEP